MRKLFARLPPSRGKRILAIIGLLLGAGFFFLVVPGVAGFFLFRSPKFQRWLWPRVMHLQATFKGDGTFLSALRSYKRPFKLDLNRHETNQQLVGRTSINFNNLSADQSCLSDTLAYEFLSATNPAASAASAASWQDCSTP